MPAASPSRLADEALDIDKDVVFKHYQSSIRSLGNLTNIDFRHLEKFDTFAAGANGTEDCPIQNVESIMLG